MEDTAEIEVRVEGLLAEPTEGLGYRLLEVQFRFEGRWVLRLVIDGEDGIGLDDCGAVSELAGRILEVEDPVPSGFSLEVTSPGLFRPLKAPEHFRQSIGKIARITLAPEVMTDAKERSLRGCIREVTEDAVILESGGEKQEVPLEGIRKARLDPDL